MTKLARGVFLRVGKPNPEPYALAERMLTSQAVDLGLVPKECLTQLDTTKDNAKHRNHHQQQQQHHASTGSQQQHIQPRRGRGMGPLATPFSGIYAVGDNPAADVRGANRAGHPWVSVLVQTGEALLT